MNEMEEVRIWETFSRDQIEQIIQGNIRSVDEKMGQMMELFITSGYYLRRQYNEKMYLEAGYDRFEDYVKDRYGKSRSWATRMMQINEQYSIDGNDPRIDPKYKLYGISQLQEMLYLTDVQKEQVSPDMTVKEIRALKAPVEERIPGQMKVEDFPEMLPEAEDAVSDQTEIVIKPTENVIDSDQEDTDELLCDTCVNASSLTGNPDQCQNCIDGQNHKARCIAGKSGSGICGAAAYCNEPVNCCEACQNDCNGRCGWLEKPAEKSGPEINFKALDKMIEVATSQKPSEESQHTEALQEESEADEVIDADYTEISETVTPQSLLADAKKWLEEYINCDAPKPLIEKQKIYVAALAGMVCDLEDTWTEPDPPVQPQLPVMKNTDQRKAWLQSYKSWGVWYYDDHIDVYYYKYDFDNGDRLIVAEYPNRGSYWYGDGATVTEKYYHLIQQVRECYNGRTYFHKFAHAPESETYMVDYLKRVNTR